MKVHEFSIGWALKQSNVEAALQQVMNNVKSWTGAKSETFSAVAGEDVTRLDVLKAHACLALLALVMCVPAWIFGEGGAL